MRYRVLGPLSLALVATLGCGEVPVMTTVPVSGRITMGGEAIEGATVAFHSRSATGKSATGKTDEQGNFTLTTYLNPRESPAGALPGEYEVSVVKLGPPAPGATGPTPGVAAASTYLLPEKYSKQGSGLKAVVTEGGSNEFDFDLEVDHEPSPPDPTEPGTSNQEPATSN